MIDTFDIMEINKRGFLTEAFEEPVLYAPARTDLIAGQCTKLEIITAFTDCERISTHMIGLSEGMSNNRFVKPLSVEIILGMTKSSLSKKKHEDICRLVQQINENSMMPNLSCRYICSGCEVHSKIYLWSRPDEYIDYVPSFAYCGSLNYTMNAFFKRRESVCVCDPVNALFYYRELLKDTIDCLSPEAPNQLKNITNGMNEDIEGPDNSEQEYLKYDAMMPMDKLEVSLLKSDGSGTGYGSGVNWGIRPNGTARNPNQAYIPYNKLDKKEGFFPDRINPDDENCPMFRVITKDYGAFHMRMAQAGNKGLHSVESNAIIGEWIRKKIGVPSGGFVTKQMLEHYGKTYVTFRKYQDGVYILDF